MTRTQASAEPIAYPYARAPLVPAWRSRRSQALAAAALIALAVAAFLYGPVTLAGIDDFALRRLTPAMLGMVLSIAPRPPTRLGQIVKDFTVLSLFAAIFAGEALPLMIASFPLVLAAAALFSRTRLARRFWPEAA